MKRFFLFLITLFLVGVIQAQVSTETYIRSRRMLNASGSAYLDDIAYYDGLGRPQQRMLKGITPGKGNLATLCEYDRAGRLEKEWLPVATASDYLPPASYRSAAPGQYGGDSKPYALSVYESSPLGRLREAYAPGEPWHDGHPARTEYSINLTASPLDCKQYEVDAGGNLVSNGSYMAAQLWVEKRSDEEGHPVYTFTDKQGRTVLSRRMKGTEAHDTYYVYDAYDRLCYVLPPMYQTEADLGKYAFQYRYNDRDLPVRKQLPGAAYVEYEYDVNDRPAFSQDGNQRTAGKWTYYLYDGLGRLTEQGECTNKSTLAGKSVLVKNYYDSYAFVGGTGFPAATFPADATGYGKGRLTGSEVAVPGSGTKLHNAYYYDVKGRTTKTVQGNLLGGYEVTATTYTFTDLPAMVSHTHTARGKTTRTEAYTYTYDHADRLAKVEHTLGGVKVTLASYTYDDLGRLSTKSPHGSAANKLTYAYNIRGWLTGISGAKFTQNLYYNTGAGTPLYNGNVSSMTWKAGTESTVRGYKFTYDLLDRMLNATYGETASITANINRFSENVTGYDKNGNILRLTRFGQTGASVYGLIDNLTYTLTGNQLNRVDDAVTASAYGSGFGFQDAVKQANEYAYDANGNLTKDLNKNIASISYNCLNLPSVVTFTGGSSIRYTYAADGRKLRVTHILGGVGINTDYCGNVVYEAGAQKYLLTEEGYVSLNDSQYHYYLKDHQGNNRVVISSSGTVEEVTHYYPFGGIFAKTNNVQPYKYNGKELDTKMSLNWYDYGARHYDAALGRFHTNDRFAEKYYSLSPYQYGANNPVGNIDVNGDSIIILPNINGILDNVKSFFGLDTKYQIQVKADLRQLKQEDSKVAKFIIELEKSSNIHYIDMPSKGKNNSAAFDENTAKKGIPQGSVIKYDPYKKEDVNGNKRTPRIGLSHELRHSFDVDKGLFTTDIIDNGIPIMEVRAVNTENRIRKKIGEPKRTTYGGKKIPEELLY